MQNRNKLEIFHTENAVLPCIINKFLQSLWASSKRYPLLCVPALPHHTTSLMHVLPLLLCSLCHPSLSTHPFFFRSIFQIRFPDSENTLLAFCSPHHQFSKPAPFMPPWIRILFVDWSGWTFQLNVHQCSSTVLVWVKSLKNPPFPSIYSLLSVWKTVKPKAMYRNIYSLYGKMYFLCGKADLIYL